MCGVCGEGVCGGAAARRDGLVLALERAEPVQDLVGDAALRGGERRAFTPLPSARLQRQRRLSAAESGAQPAGGREVPSRSPCRASSPPRAPSQPPARATCPPAAGAGRGGGVSEVWHAQGGEPARAEAPLFACSPELCGARAPLGRRGRAGCSGAARRGWFRRRPAQKRRGRRGHTPKRLWRALLSSRERPRGRFRRSARGAAPRLYPEDGVPLNVDGGGVEDEPPGLPARLVLQHEVRGDHAPGRARAQGR